MCTGVSFLVKFLENCVFAVDEVYEDYAAEANDWQGCKNDQTHSPPKTDGNGSSAGKHSEKVEHTTYLLSCCFLISQ